jgi:Matrixin
MSLTPPPLGPDLVPPRPDRAPVEDEAASPRLFVAFVAATLVAILLGGLAVAAVLRGPSDTRDAAAGTPSASPTATVAPSRSATPSPRPKVDGDFRFLERVGGAPVRWNPCDEISYAVNTAGASSSIRSDLRVALARVTRATGIDFRSVGTTRESFFRAYQRMRFNGVIGRAELIMIWVDHDGYQAILQRLQDPRPSIAFAKTMAGVTADQDQYFGGIIVMDAGATSFLGFGYRYAHGVVLLHELGHIMGLDHVKDREQVMYTGRRPDYSVVDYGQGDLEGLRRLGEDSGCL